MEKFMIYDDDDSSGSKTRSNNLRTEERRKEHDPFSELALGVIRQAFIDIFDYLDNKKKPYSEEYYYDARSWMVSDEEFDDFKFWCDKAGIDALAVRFAMLKSESDEKFRGELFNRLGIHKVY